MLKCSPRCLNIHLQAASADLRPAKHTDMVPRMDRLIFGKVLKFTAQRNGKINISVALTTGREQALPSSGQPRYCGNNPEENNHTALVDFSFSFLWKYVTVILHFFKCPEGEQKKKQHLETLKNKHRE